MRQYLFGGMLAASILVVADTAHAAAALDGTALRWPWALPFVGILLTIATGPLVFPKLWHRHYGKLAFVWSTLTVAPLAALYGTPAAVAAFVHAMLAEYLSFIVLLFALYVVAGGILVTGNLRGTPLVNTVILAFGTLIASVVGTTGAAMILIRPLLHANAARLHNVHVVVFFIFLVANIGGALSPLGDPPLFVGFLHGVEFFWTTQHLWRPTALVAGLVLLIFIVLDVWYYRKDRLVTTVGEARAPVDLGVSGVEELDQRNPRLEVCFRGRMIRRESHRRRAHRLAIVAAVNAIADGGTPTPIHHTGLLDDPRQAPPCVDDTRSDDRTGRAGVETAPARSAAIGLRCCGGG